MPWTREPHENAHAHKFMTGADGRFVDPSCQAAALGAINDKLIEPVYLVYIAKIVTHARTCLSVSN